VFRETKFIKYIFKICAEIDTKKNSITAERIFEINPSNSDIKEEDYWHKKNITDALTIIEKMKLINGKTKPEYTKNLGLLKPIRHAKISKWGEFFRKLPDFLKELIIYIYLTRNTILFILGCLSLVKLGKNALEGAIIIATLYEAILVIILTYIVILILKRLLG